MQLIEAINQQSSLRNLPLLMGIFMRCLGTAHTMFFWKTTHEVPRKVVTLCEKPPDDMWSLQNFLLYGELLWSPYHLGGYCKLPLSKGGLFNMSWYYLWIKDKVFPKPRPDHFLSTVIVPSTHVLKPDLVVVVCVVFGCWHCDCDLLLVFVPLQKKLCREQGHDHTVRKFQRCDDVRAYRLPEVRRRAHINGITLEGPLRLVKLIRLN
jgi:hypothetical protein